MSEETICEVCGGTGKVHGCTEYDICRANSGAEDCWNPEVCTGCGGSGDAEGAL